MSKVYRFAAYGWPHQAANAPRIFIGRYRTRVVARIAAWWFGVCWPDGHAWVSNEHHIVLVENGRRV